jgi:hypothetical protein
LKRSEKEQQQKLSTEKWGLTVRVRALVVVSLNNFQILSIPFRCKKSFKYSGLQGDR